MSYGSETPHVWSSSSGSEVSPYGPLWDAPPAPVPYPDILAFPPSDLVWSAAGCGGRGGPRSTPTGKKPRRRVASVAQRRAANIRERRRMFNLNEAFDKLRRKVPTFAYEKRLSRIETLRLAITYISFMCELLHGSPQPHHPTHPLPPRHVFEAEVLILTTTTAVLSSPRQKRHLSYIKDLITKTLFGEDLVILQQPKIPKNEPFKLFKVEGHDNTLLKVIRKLKKQAVVAENVKDPVIVKPEIAIIGNYLGTTTQRETLLAIEMVRDLLRSGILNENHDKLIRKVSFPIPAQLPLASCVHEPLVITEETHPMYLPPIVNKPVPIAVHIPSLVSPIQTKYAYEQKGYDADMKYQSYNNQDVIVTRINKEPVLPDVIKMRLSDVASIGTHTFNSRAHVIEMPKPYSQHSIKEPQYSVPNHSGLLVPTNTNFNENETRVNSLSNQNDFVINKFTEAEKDKVNQPADKKTAQASPLSVKQENSNQNATPEGNNKDGVTKKSEWNGEFVRKYIYKQNTNNKLGESPKLTSNSDNIKTNENHDISSDFMYVPPQNADVPLPNSVLKTNNLRSNERGDISEDRENEYYSNVNSDEKSIPRKSIISDYSLTNPIVVEEPAGKKFHYIDGSIF